MVQSATLLTAIGRCKCSIQITEVIFSFISTCICKERASSTNKLLDDAGETQMLFIESKVSHHLFLLQSNSLLLQNNTIFFDFLCILIHKAYVHGDWQHFSNIHKSVSNVTG